jgi:hypothetical protein
MTGISDIARHARSLRRSLLMRFLMLFPIIVLNVCKDYLVPLDYAEIGTMPKPKLGYFQEKSQACNPFKHDIELQESSIWHNAKSDDFLKKIEAKGTKGRRLKSLNPARIEGTNLGHLSSIISARRGALQARTALGMCK